ncbi:MAG: DUF3316 domain-containing protein [Dysgonamonadaceae bacterium]|jgi:hypothetical protein|nr:DUF3316 domain-containing protein [Dysgonamonadaceae bacterium]
MKKCILLIFIVSGFYVSAQESVNLTYRSTIAGLGVANVYDSYLSPLKYSGIKSGLVFEQMRNTNIGENIVSQNLFDIAYMQAKNPAGTATCIAGTFQYDYGLFYKFKIADRLRLFAGTQADCLLGFILNSRNGNNPATGKFHLNLNFSAIASYTVNIKSLPLRFLYQTSSPFVGYLYATEYGQSYYEIGLGDSERLMHLSSFHNYLFFKNTVTVEIPIKETTFRFGYIHSFYQTKINSLESQVFSNSVYAGVTRNLFAVPAKKLNQYRSVFE